MTPEELFRGFLDGSVRRRRLGVSVLVSEYVVRVLVGMVHRVPSDGPVCVRTIGVLDEPVLRLAADEALFVSGYFPEHLARRGLAPSYLARLGSGAYRAVARRRGEPFGELAERFPDLQDVVGDIRRECDAAGMDAMALLSAWLQTGSEPFRRRLAELGVLVPRPGSS